MKEKIFTFNDLEIWREGNSYFAVYDAGAHQVTLRKDRITENDAKLACTGQEGATQMLFALQQRLIENGENPYIANYSP